MIDVETRFQKKIKKTAKYKELWELEEFLKEANSWSTEVGADIIYYKQKLAKEIIKEIEYSEDEIDEPPHKKSRH